MPDARARLLLLRAYLMEHTDERHSVTAREIVAHLELSAFCADRRAVYADIELLRESGLDIRVKRRRANEYYLHTRVFERTELRLLADMIRASRVLSREHSEAMIVRLASIVSRHDAAWLRRQRGAASPHKPDHERAFHNASQVLLALEHGSKFSFVYCQFTARKALSTRRGGETYIVNPCLLVYAEDHYYLIADHPFGDGIAHYRLDQMEEVRALEAPAAPADISFDAAAYARSVFSMASAELRWVHLSFDRQLLGAMLDRFGADVPVGRMDEDTLALFAPVCVSPPFFGWVFQFGGRVRILAPEDVREQMLLMLEASRAPERGR
jgi:predicted DNA-binding transcriptional regulator YafY